MAPPHGSNLEQRLNAKIDGIALLIHSNGRQISQLDDRLDRMESSLYSFIKVEVERTQRM